MIAAEGIRIVFALIAVLGLIGLGAVLLRKAGLVSASGGFVRKRRLAVVETLALDARRRVAIIRCDGKEHLIVLGAAGETLIDSDLEGAPKPETAPAADNPFPALASFAAKRRQAAKDAA